MLEYIAWTPVEGIASPLAGHVAREVDVEDIALAPVEYIGLESAANTAPALARVSSLRRTLHVLSLPRLWDEFEAVCRHFRND